MAPYLQPLDHIDIDLTDEQGVLAEHSVEHDPESVRALLAALNLRAAGAPPADDRAVRFDFAVYRATGDRHLASIFGRAA